MHAAHASRVDLGGRTRAHRQSRMSSWRLRLADSRQERKARLVQRRTDWCRGSGSPRHRGQGEFLETDPRGELLDRVELAVCLDIIGAPAAVHDAVAQQRLGQPVTARIRSARVASRQRTRSRADSCSSVGTWTGTTSSSRSRASSSASRVSVLTRSPPGRRIFEAAATSQRTPAPASARASQNPCRAGLVHRGTRARQTADPRDDLGRGRTQPGLEHLTGQAVDRGCRDRPGVHVQAGGLRFYGVEPVRLLLPASSAALTRLAVSASRGRSS